MPTSDYTPTVDEVGAILRARTKDSNGNEVGTFNANTRPTDVEITALIGDAVDEVASSISSDVPDGPDADDPEALRRAAKRLATLYTAMLVELTYFPEQVSTNRSAYDKYKELFDARLKTLVAAIEEQGGDAVDPGAGAGTNTHALASFSFPDDDNLIGYRSRW